MSGVAGIDENSKQSHELASWRLISRSGRRLDPGPYLGANPPAGASTTLAHRQIRKGAGAPTGGGKTQPRRPPRQPRTKPHRLDGSPWVAEADPAPARQARCAETGPVKVAKDGFGGVN